MKRNYLPYACPGTAGGSESKMVRASPPGEVGWNMLRSVLRVQGKTLNCIAPIGMATADVESAPRSKDDALRGSAPTTGFEYFDDELHNTK